VARLNARRKVLSILRCGLPWYAEGVNLRRNIWQDEHPVAMTRAVRAVIHKKATPKEAQETYESEKSKKSK
jgi:putative autoinducer-2 (AI-2) aldolase